MPILSIFHDHGYFLEDFSWPDFMNRGKVTTYVK